MEQNKQEKGLVKREEFGGVETQRLAETASTAVAAREQATIAAMCRYAELHPRNIEAARAGILKDCQRPGFAGSLEHPVAMYNRKVGTEQDPVTGKWRDSWAQGASVRLIESAFRHMRNIYVSQSIVYDDDEMRIVRVCVTDIEGNIPIATEVTIPKRVEKRGFGRDQEPPKGRDPISVRLNSEGRKTYLVRATDAEVITLQNNLVSKAIRTNGQRLVPHDIIEEALAMIRKTQAKEDAKDPDAAKRKIIDAFGAVGVSPEMLQEYLDHPLEQMQPKELEELRAVHGSIRDGNASWGEIMDERGPSGSADEQEQKMAEQLARLRAKEAKKPEPKPEEKPAESDEDRKEREQLEKRKAEYEKPNPRRQLTL